jgi:HD-GYP domain-containing protein (c-di-GMP phosphodiesterase class II)
VETAVEALTEDDNVFTLLDSLNKHADFLFAHSMGVSLYGVLLARAVDWKLPTNSFKIATAGILHEIGLKELDRDLLIKPRGDWSVDEVKRYETHPTRGVEILSHIQSVNSDVLEIIKQHHENVKGLGYPSRLKRAAIHPMAKLVAVADEFCDRVIRGPNNPGVTPGEAISQMRTLCADKLDPQFFDALIRTLTPAPPETPP